MRGAVLNESIISTVCDTMLLTVLISTFRPATTLRVFAVLITMNDTKRTHFAGQRKCTAAAAAAAVLCVGQPVIEKCAGHPFVVMVTDCTVQDADNEDTMA